MIANHEVKDVMAAMPYGLYIVGSRDGDEFDGMMADWVMQVSFEPRMVAVSIENDARTLANIRATGAFTVSLLPEDEAGMALAAKFAQPYLDEKVRGRPVSLPRVHHKLESVPHSETRTGYPVIDRAMAWVECEAREFVPVGDHTLVVGHVRDGLLVRDENPLTSTFTGWNYSG